jgi:DNA-binding transcriptional LysR family regulator
MDNFPISPEVCLILKAFNNSKSLREAASLLRADPAGLTRKAQQISSQHGFLQKVNNRWQVTARGLDLVAWVDSSIQSQKKTLFFKSGIRLASTMWFSEEVIVPNLLKLKNAFGENLNFSLSVPSQEFELSLIDGSVDFVIVCHPPENPEIEHRQIAQEDWVLIAPKSWKQYLKINRRRIIEAISGKPFIRHSELNHDLFMTDFFNSIESEFSIDNLIGIRSAVCEGLGWSLVPRILVSRHIADGRLIEIPYDIQVTDRKICLWWLRNRHESKRQSAKIAAWLKDCFVS